MIKKTILILTFILLLNTFFASALDQELFTTLNELKNEYNQNINQVPGIIKTMLSNEKINVYIDDNLIGITTKKAVITALESNGIENPDINAYLSEETLSRLINRELSIEEALSSQQLTYKANNFTTKIKLGIIKTFLEVRGWFV